MPSRVVRVVDPGVVVVPSFAFAVGEVGPSRLTVWCVASALLADEAIYCNTCGGALLACMVAVSPILPSYVAGCQMVGEASVDESLSCPFLMGTTCLESSA